MNQTQGKMKRIKIVTIVVTIFVVLSVCGYMAFELKKEQELQAIEVAKEEEIKRLEAEKRASKQKDFCEHEVSRFALLIPGVLELEAIGYSDPVKALKNHMRTDNDYLEYMLSNFIKDEMIDDANNTKLKTDEFEKKWRDICFNLSFEKLESWAVPVNEINKSKCNLLSKTAKKIMEIRQYEGDVSLAELMEMASGSKSIESMTIQAFSISKFSTEKYQREAVNDFSNNTYLKCIETFNQ